MPAPAVRSRRATGTGTYHCARAFLPLLVASGDGVIVNTSSVSGFWAILGPGMPNSAYATAKFAIKGFTGALIEDLRTNAPQVRAVLVMPGHVGTDIVANSRRAQGLPEPGQMTEAQLQRLIPGEARAALARAGALSAEPSTGELRELVARMERDFRERAPTTMPSWRDWPPARGARRSPAKVERRRP
ncbi:MAG: SDR family oxidoreductase [Solirubrobacteraceae bacterium]